MVAYTLEHQAFGVFLFCIAGMLERAMNKFNDTDDLCSTPSTQSGTPTSPSIAESTTVLPDHQHQQSYNAPLIARLPAAAREGVHNQTPVRGWVLLSSTARAWTRARSVRKGVVHSARTPAEAAIYLALPSRAAECWTRDTRGIEALRWPDPAWPESVPV